MHKSVVAIVKNPTAPDAARIDGMVREAIDLLGGIGKFVKSGDYVTIKGNFFAPYPPPVTVDRRVVSALIKEIYRAGASRVVLCEGVSVGTKLERGSSTAFVLEELGIKEVALAAGAEVLCLEDDERITVKIPDGKCIGEVEYPRCMYDCDVLINLPCMKTHYMTLVTLGLKNFQGILTDEQKYYAHRDDFEQKLVDLQKVRKPDLTIIDGLIAMEGNGAGEHGIPHPMNMLIASSDVVAADAVAVSCMGIKDVLDVALIRLAQHDGIGNADLDQIQVVGARIEDVKEDFLLPTSYLKPQGRYVTGVYKNLDIHIGGACKQCWGLVQGICRILSNFKDKRFTIFVGSDPKLPNPIKTDLDNVIFFGDCACAATGNIKELRNKMLLEGKGLFALGCPPYRPATAAVEKYLLDRGMITRETLEARYQAAVKKTYEYYKSIDPTWVPMSERR